MSEKTLGYSLLVSGVVLILIALIYVVLIFTGHAKPAPLFNFPSISLDPNTLMSGSTLPPGMTLNQTTAPKQELISGAMLNESSNLFASLFLMGFVASIGQKLASLGTTLLRPIEVKVKTKEV